MATTQQQFSSQPQAVQNTQKYREEDGRNSTNIMHDRRVVRGNTYAALVVPQDDPAELARHREAQKRRLKKANKSRFTQRPGTPEPVPGRHHMDVQCDSYLEELTERATEFEAETQTDFLLDRPATPLYMPAKSGTDQATQIEEGELFDFDSEVEPILEVLVGKTLERSMMELLEEAELNAMQLHQQHFQQLREQELIEVQRMEAAEQRRQDEISRRTEQAGARKRLDAEVTRKILSRNISRSYLSGLTQRCFDELYDAGIFHDSNLIGVEGHFVPWLLDSMQQKIVDLKNAGQVLAVTTKASINEKRKTHDKVIAKYSDLLDEVEAAERRVRAERDEEKRLAELEAKRIESERERLKLSEDEDWISTYTVVSYVDGVLTLDDESTDIQVPAEMEAELIQKLTPPEEEEAEIPVLKVMVNKTKRVLLEFLAPVPAEEAPPGDE